MIPRLPSRARRLASDDWPDDISSRGRGDGLFRSREPHRRLRLVVDHELLSDPSTEAERVLSELVGHGLLRVFRFADGRVVPPAPDGTPAAGWLVLDRRDDRVGARFLVDDSDITSSLGLGERLALLDTVWASDLLDDLPVDRASERRRRDAVAVAAAGNGASADVYVTRRPYALWLAEQDTWAASVAVLDASRALAIIGLYMRSQGRHPVAANVSLDHDLFFGTGARAALPTQAHWEALCAGAEQNPYQAELLALASSLLLRVVHALELRDEIHLSLNIPGLAEHRPGVSGRLELLLVTLVAMLDITARTAHRVLDIDKSPTNAGWTKQGWRRTVDPAAPQLAALVDEGTDGSFVLGVLRLRNQIHEKALRSIGVRSVGQLEPEQFVVLPSPPDEQAMKAIERLGGVDRWGVQSLSTSVALDAGLFADAAFHSVTALVDRQLRTLVSMGLDGSIPAMPHKADPHRGKASSVSLQFGLTNVVPDHGPAGHDSACGQ